MVPKVQIWFSPLALFLTNITVKLLKIQTTQKNAVITLKFEQSLLYHRVMHPKDADRMANSADPWSDCSSRISLIWVYTVCSGLSVRKLKDITVSDGWFLGYFVQTVLGRQRHQPWARLKKGCSLHSRWGLSLTTFVKYGIFIFI